MLQLTGDFLALTNSMTLKAWSFVVCCAFANNIPSSHVLLPHLLAVNLL